MEFAPRPELKPDAEAFNYAITRAVLSAEDLVRSVGPEGLYDRWQEQREMFNVELSVDPKGTIQRLSDKTEFDYHLQDLIEEHGIDPIDEMTDVEMALEDLAETIMGGKYAAISDRGPCITTQKQAEEVNAPEARARIVTYTQYRVVGGEVVAEHYVYDAFKLPAGERGKQYLNAMIAEGKAMGMNAMPIPAEHTEALMKELANWQYVLDQLAQFKGQGSDAMLGAIQDMIDRVLDGEI